MFLFLVFYCFTFIEHFDTIIRNSHIFLLNLKVKQFCPKIPLFRKRQSVLITSDNRVSTVLRMSCRIHDNALNIRKNNIPRGLLAVSPYQINTLAGFAHVVFVGDPQFRLVVNQVRVEDPSLVTDQGVSCETSLNKIQ